MSQKYPAEEVGRRGQKLYDERIRPLVEPGNAGKIVVIDVDTGDYLVGTDLTSMSHELRHCHADAALYALRIGAPAFSRIGGRRPARSA